MTSFYHLCPGRGQQPENVKIPVNWLAIFTSTANLSIGGANASATTSGRAGEIQTGLDRRWMHANLMGSQYRTGRAGPGADWSDRPGIVAARLSTPWRSRHRWQFKWMGMGLSDRTDGSWNGGGGNLGEGQLSDGSCASSDFCWRICYVAVGTIRCL